MKRKVFFSAFMICLVFNAFAQVQTVWKDTRFMKEPLAKIAIISQFRDTDARNVMETIMLDALRSNGIEAISIYDMIHYDSMFYYSTIERKLDSAGVDGLLIIKMLDAENTDLYIAPGDVIPPYAYNYYEYYSFYYYHDLPIIIYPEYYDRTDLGFRIDFYLYQNKGDMVVWGGKSKLIDPNGLEKPMSKLGKKVVKFLVKEDIVTSQD